MLHFKSGTVWLNNLLSNLLCFGMYINNIPFLIPLLIFPFLQTNITSHIYIYIYTTTILLYIHCVWKKIGPIVLRA